VANEIKTAGGKASAAAINVADPGQASRMAEIAIDRYGTIDILCANAGIFPASKLERMTGPAPVWWSVEYLGSGGVI